MPFMTLPRLLRVLFVAAALCGPGLALAGEVAVSGSDRKVTDTRQAVIGGKAVDLKLTGASLREKAFINVYVIASYVASGTSPKSASELASVDAPKQMVLTMERDVEGPKMAEALSDAVRANYPSGMDTELGQLEGFLKANPLHTGNEVSFTWEPGGALVCALTGKSPVTIKSAAFARAVWDIWLGAKPVQSDIKKDLAARL